MMIRKALGSVRLRHLRFYKLEQEERTEEGAGGKRKLNSTSNRQLH